MGKAQHRSCPTVQLALQEALCPEGGCFPLPLVCAGPGSGSEGMLSSPAGMQVLALALSLCKPPASANWDEDPEQAELTAEVGAGFLPTVFGWGLLQNILCPTTFLRGLVVTSSPPSPPPGACSPLLRGVAPRLRTPLLGHRCHNGGGPPVSTRDRGIREAAPAHHTGEQAL